MRSSIVDIRDRAYSLVLSLVSSAAPSDNQSMSRTELWLDIIVFLSQGGTCQSDHSVVRNQHEFSLTVLIDESQAATKVLERALKDIPEDGLNFLSNAGDRGMSPTDLILLCTTLNNPGPSVKLTEPLQTVLSRSLSAGLGSGSNEEMRANAVHLFNRLINPTETTAKSDPGHLAPDSSTPYGSDAQSYAGLIGRNSAFSSSYSSSFL